MATKTTAISKYNVIATYGSGKAGNVRLYQKGNQSYLRAAYNGAKSSVRTEAQMRNRIKWASMSSPWKIFNSYLQKAFWGVRNGNASDFNMFMKYNLDNGVFLTKEQNARRQMIVLPYILSVGKLPVVDGIIKATGTSDISEFDINLNCSLSGEYTYRNGDVAANILENNEWLRENDLISVFIIKEVNALFHRVEIDTCSFLLNTHDDKVQSGWEGNNFTSLSYGQNSALNFFVPNLTYTTDKFAIGVIVSRKVNGKLVCSTCQMICSPSCDYESYRSNNAFQNALESYGGLSQNVFIDPNKKLPMCIVELRVMPNPTDGTVSGAGTYTRGSSVQISATAASGKTFDKWSDGVTIASRTIEVNGDVTLNAIFKNQ